MANLPDWAALITMTTPELQKQLRLLTKRARQRYVTFTPEQKAISKIVQRGAQILAPINRKGLTPQELRGSMLKRISDLEGWLSNQSTTRTGLTQWANNEKQAIKDALKRAGGLSAADEATINLMTIADVQQIAEFTGSIRNSRAAWATAYNSEGDIGRAAEIWIDLKTSGNPITLANLKAAADKYLSEEYARTHPNTGGTGGRTGIKF